jgi:hypothetical protein
MAPAPAGPGTRPGAGTVLVPPRQVPAPAAGLSEITHDPARSLFWTGHTTGGVLENIRSVFPDTLLPAPRTIQTDELDAGPGSPAGPDVDGPVNGLGLLASGNLLASDDLGDNVRFSDTLYEVDPTTGALVHFWYLNGQACDTCRPNTNTDLPQRHLWTVGALSASRGDPASDPVFVARRFNNRAATVLARVRLLPGTPGSWSLVQDVPSPCAATPTGIAFDPDQAALNGLPNVYWFVSRGNQQIFECTWNPGRQDFQVNQAVPAPFAGTTPTTNRIDTCVAPELGSRAPHALVLGETDVVPGNNLLVKVAAGFGDPDPAAEGFPLYHSTLDTNLFIPTDPVVFNEEVQLWPGRGDAPIADQNQQQQASPLFPERSAQVLNDVDALALRPDFVGDDPTFFDFYWSDRVDLIVERGTIRDGDVVRVRPDCSIERLLAEPLVISVAGLTSGTADVDGLAILPSGDLLISFSDTSMSTNAPNFQGQPILDGDVIVIPASRAPQSAYWVYREAEIPGMISRALGEPPFALTELDGLEIDPLGELRRPNPYPGGTTRPDILFTADFTGTAGGPSGFRTNHVFSTRSGPRGDGVVVRDARIGGYAATGGLAGGVQIDALALAPMGVRPAPVTDSFVQPNGADPALQTIRIIGRNLTPDGAVVFAFGLERACPAIRAAGFRHYPFQLFAFTVRGAFADANGLAELVFEVPHVGGVRYLVQAIDAQTMSIGTVTTVDLLP